MLHIVNKSPRSCDSLGSCLRFAQPGDALLLIEDAVYAATTGSGVEASVRAACASLQVHALQPDIDARGMAGRVIDGVALVDYGGFVDLAARHNNAHTWL